MIAVNNRSNFNLIHYLIFFNLFCLLFKPFWMIAFYVPQLAFLKSISTVISIGIFVLFFTSPEKKIVYKPIVIYCLVIFLTIIFAVNTGIARTHIVGLVSLLIGHSVWLTFIKEKHINTIFFIFICAGFLLSIFGILGHGLVKWHVVLDNEDAFGPFMCICFGLSFWQWQYHKKANEPIKKFYLLSMLMSLIGIVASIARGSFVALIMLFLVTFHRYDNKIRFITMCLLLLPVIAISSLTLFEGKTFWNEMGTIVEEGKEEGSGKDRWNLWGKAVEIFKDHPLLGVGPRNYGFVLPRYADEKFYRGYHIYGRAPHNIYFQILAEGGLIRIISFFALIYLFFKNNKTIRVLSSDINKNIGCNEIHIDKKYLHLDKTLYFSLSLELGMLAYLFNGFFYDILDYGWFFQFIIINQLVYNNTIERSNPTLENQ